MFKVFLKIIISDSGSIKKEMAQLTIQNTLLKPKIIAAYDSSSYVNVAK